MHAIKIPRIGTLVALGLLFMSASARALEPEVLYSFNAANGALPYAGLVLGSDDTFYGTAVRGGSNNLGTVFQVTTSGVLTMLVSFIGANGDTPEAGLVLGGDGKFYGTTFGGGGFGHGTVFQVTTNGVLTTLASFNNTNGANPQAGLVLGNDGNFYGTTYYGGGSYEPGLNRGFGTVFQVTTSGMLTTLVSFTGANGAYPEAGLALGSDARLYGTTSIGGSGGYGTVFQVTTNGVLTTLVSFNGTNGSSSSASLAQGNDGNFYGTTAFGGIGFIHSVYSGHGTVFQITPGGVLTTLVFFDGTNGTSPRAGLAQGSDGNFYGTTVNGGSGGYGTVFQATPNGSVATLVSFNNANGANPFAELVLGNDGNFYGTTSGGGPGGDGTIFGLVMPKFASVARLPAGGILLTGSGPANEGYRLWASQNVSLPFASWTLLTSNAFDSNSSFSYTDAGVAANAPRFYRLTVP